MQTATATGLVDMIRTSIYWHKNYS